MADGIAADVDGLGAYPGKDDVIAVQLCGHILRRAGRRDADGGCGVRPGAVAGRVVGLHSILVGHVGLSVDVSIVRFSQAFGQVLPLAVAHAVPDPVAVYEGAVGGRPGQDVVVLFRDGAEPGGFAGSCDQRDGFGCGPGGSAILVAVLHPVAVSHVGLRRVVGVGAVRGVNEGGPVAVGLLAGDAVFDRGSGRRRRPSQLDGAVAGGGGQARRRCWGLDGGGVGRHADVVGAIGHDQVGVGDSGLGGGVHQDGLGGQFVECDGYVFPFVGIWSQIPEHHVADDVRSRGWSVPRQRDVAVEGIGDRGGQSGGWQHGSREYFYRGFRSRAGADGVPGRNPVGVLPAEGGGVVAERRCAGVRSPEFGFLVAVGTDDGVTGQRVGCVALVGCRHRGCRPRQVDGGRFVGGLGFCYGSGEVAGRRGRVRDICGGGFGCWAGAIGAVGRDGVGVRCSRLYRVVGERGGCSVGRKCLAVSSGDGVVGHLGIWCIPADPYAGFLTVGDDQVGQGVIRCSWRAGVGVGVALMDDG